MHGPTVAACRAGCPAAAVDTGPAPTRRATPVRADHSEGPGPRLHPQRSAGRAYTPSADPARAYTSTESVPRLHPQRAAVRAQVRAAEQRAVAADDRLPAAERQRVARAFGAQPELG